jgi:hypothetical protein
MWNKGGEDKEEKNEKATMGHKAHWKPVLSLF